jgi:hypothetical protein
VPEDEFSDDDLDSEDELPEVDKDERDEERDHTAAAAYFRVQDGSAIEREIYQASSAPNATSVRYPSLLLLLFLSFFLLLLLLLLLPLLLICQYLLMLLEGAIAVRQLPTSRNLLKWWMHIAKNIALLVRVFVI